MPAAAKNAASESSKAAKKPRVKKHAVKDKHEKKTTTVVPVPVAKENKKPRGRGKKQQQQQQKKKKNNDDLEIDAAELRRMSASILAQRKAEKFRSLDICNFVGRSAFQVGDEDVIPIDNAVLVKPAFPDNGIQPTCQTFSMCIPPFAQWTYAPDTERPFFVIVQFAHNSSLRYQVRDAAPKSSKPIPIERNNHPTFYIGQKMYHSKNAKKQNNAWKECSILRVEHKRCVHVVYEKSELSEIAQEAQVPWSLVHQHLRLHPEPEILEEKQLSTLSTTLIKPVNPTSSSSSKAAKKKSWRIVNADPMWEARLIVTVPDSDI